VFALVGTETAFHNEADRGDYSWIANARLKHAEFVAWEAIRAMLSGRRTLVPGLFNQLSYLRLRIVYRTRGDSP